MDRSGYLADHQEPIVKMAGQRQKRQEILKKLREASLGKIKRSDQYQVVGEADIYEDLTEEQYQRRVQENRATGFIEDDMDIGYDDKGEVE